MSCTCPDWADMCKHVAATLYGAGARLDQAPELLFTLRGVDSAELIASAGNDGALLRASASSQRILAADDVAALFGIEMAPPPVASAPPPKKAGKRAREKTAAGSPESSEGNADKALGSEKQPMKAPSARDVVPKAGRRSKAREPRGSAPADAAKAETVAAVKSTTKARKTETRQATDLKTVVSAPGSKSRKNEQAPAAHARPNGSAPKSENRADKSSLGAKSAHLQPFLELRPTSLAAMGPHSNRQSLALANKDDETLPTRHRGIDQVSREHCVMLGGDGDHHRRIFGTLRLMDRGRIGGDERVEFAERVCDLAPVEFGDEDAFCLVDAPDPSEVAVEHFAVVVVFRLHHLVAGRKTRAEALDLFGHVRVQGVLKIAVERSGAERPALHRTEHLDVANGIETETTGNAITNDLDDFGRTLLWFLRLDEKVVRNRRRPSAIPAFRPG